MSVPSVDPASLLSKIGEIVDELELAPELRADLLSRIESCFRDAGIPADPAGETHRKSLLHRLRQVEERLDQSRKMETVGRMTGVIAHDFNNLLTGILGHVSLLKAAIPEDAKGYKAAACIERSALRAADLTYRLREFLRRHAPHPRALDLGSILEETIGVLARSSNGNIEIRTEGDGVEGPVPGDPSAIGIALLHIGKNAIDAMPEGGVLTFSTSRLISDGSSRIGGRTIPEGVYACLSVADTGRGIPQSIRDRVFEPLFSTKPSPGCGVGLALADHCVRSQGGILDLESREGEGTTVHILLPIAGPRAGPPPHP